VCEREHERKKTREKNGDTYWGLVSVCVCKRESTRVDKERERTLR